MHTTDQIIPFAGCFTQKSLQEVQIVFVGLPDDSQSSYQRGSRLAPEQIRLAYDGNCYNSSTESGMDLAEQVYDYGDLQPKGSWQHTAHFYQTEVEKLLIAGKVPFFVGGDHAVTIPVVEALHVLGEPIHIIQIDAHPDLYEEHEGNYYSHACTVARILEMKHVATVTQIGIRTMNPAQEKIWHKYRDRLHLISAREIVEEIPNLKQIPKTASIYLTLDLDVFDPAFAPGVSHPVPGGLSPRQVLNFIQNLQGRLVGMDVVELNPERDINQQTAILAARLLHEAMGLVVLSRD